MSQENADIVRRAFDAMSRRDLDAALQDVDPEVEVDWSRSRGVDAGVYNGLDATRAFWSNFLELFDRFEVVHMGEFVEVGEHVVAPNRVRLRGRGGIDVEAEYAPVITFRDGRIVRWCLYQDRAEALEAVGLEE